MVINNQAIALLPQDDLAFIVRRAPLVSIDLIVKNKKNRILVGLRKNEPAKDYWFVPGGIVMKNERIINAVNRIIISEIGEELSNSSPKFIGVFEHFYDNNFMQSKEFGTHYIVLAYELYVQDMDREFPMDQHAKYKWISKGNRENLNIHPNTLVYINL